MSRKVKCASVCGLNTAKGKNPIPTSRPQTTSCALSGDVVQGNPLNLLDTVTFFLLPRYGVDGTVLNYEGNSTRSHDRWNFMQALEKDSDLCMVRFFSHTEWASLVHCLVVLARLSISLAPRMLPTTSEEGGPSGGGGGS